MTPFGQPVTLTFLTYSDPARTTLADATAVTLDVLDPAGATTSYTLGAILHPSTGTYTITLTPAAAGHYAYHWSSTGTVVTALDGSFDVDPKYRYALVSQADFATYLGNNAIATDNRARFILDKAQQLCETIVSPLPTGADMVILDVAERAYANPTAVGGSDLGLYSEGVGPFSTSTPGNAGGGLYLTRSNERTLRKLAGQTGGAFTIDMAPTTAPSLPWWDTGASINAAGWDTPPG